MHHNASRRRVEDLVLELILEQCYFEASNLTKLTTSIDKVWNVRSSPMVGENGPRIADGHRELSVSRTHCTRHKLIGLYFCSLLLSVLLLALVNQSLISLTAN